MTTVGLIVNPVAGLGGTVGLKGTDGADAAARALARGAVPHASERAALALSTLVARLPGVRVVTAAGDMGAEAAAAAGVEAEVVYRPVGRVAEPLAPGTAGNPAVPGSRLITSSAVDTVSAARAMRDARLILFAGGDGTARDLLPIVGERVVLGIPAGVKMHSAVFAVNARAAGEVAAAYLAGRTAAEYAEVLDRVATEGRLRTELFGRLRVPREPNRIAGGKIGAAGSGDDPAGMAAWLAATREPDGVDVFGPGTTTAAILAQLGVTAEPTGVTVVDGRSDSDAAAGAAAPTGGAAARPDDAATTARPTDEAAVSSAGAADSHPAGAGPTGSTIATATLLAADADAAVIEALTDRRPTRVIVSPIGGQGFLLGRGNQPLTPRLLRRAELVIVSGEAKLAALAGRPLLVDTGDDEVDRLLSGYRPVHTGPNRRTMYRIGAS